MPTHPPEIAELAAWSPWLSFTPANVATAPMTPGVYLFRPSTDVANIVYVGRAGERSGKGVRERLRVYVSGRAPHSGLGNLALERALANVTWLQARLDRIQTGETMTVQDWARDAVASADLEFSFAASHDGAASVRLEHATIVALHAHDLWNRRR